MIKINSCTTGRQRDIIWSGPKLVEQTSQHSNGSPADVTLLQRLETRQVMTRSKAFSKSVIASYLGTYYVLRTSVNIASYRCGLWHCILLQNQPALLLKHIESSCQMIFSNFWKQVYISLQSEIGLLKGSYRSFYPTRGFYIIHQCIVLCYYIIIIVRDVVYHNGRVNASPEAVEEGAMHATALDGWALLLPLLSCNHALSILNNRAPGFAKLRELLQAPSVEVSLFFNKKQR